MVRITEWLEQPNFLQSHRIYFGQSITGEVCYEGDQLSPNYLQNLFPVQERSQIFIFYDLASVLGSGVRCSPRQTEASLKS